MSNSNEMRLSNEFQPIRGWATEREIYSKGDVKTQYVKFQEEAGELAKSIMKKDKAEFIDGLGDVVITLVNLAELGNKFFNSPDITLESAINQAYKVIENRKGKIVGGTFVKED